MKINTMMAAAGLAGTTLVAAKLTGPYTTSYTVASLGENNRIETQILKTVVTPAAAQRAFITEAVAEPTVQPTAPYTTSYTVAFLGDNNNIETKILKTVVTPAAAEPTVTAAAGSQESSLGTITTETTVTATVAASVSAPTITAAAGAEEAKPAAAPYTTSYTIAGLDPGNVFTTRILKTVVTPPAPMPTGTTAGDLLKSVVDAEPTATTSTS